MTKKTTLFLDIGGVLLTNGWDTQARKRMVERFHLDWEDFEKRHKPVNPLFETGYMSLGEYLKVVVFWKPRNFTSDDVAEFMFSQSKPFPEMLQLFSELKEKYALRIAAVSNESRELTEHRIEVGKLKTFIDDFIVSCFVHYQKPDPVIYRMALDVTQVPLDQILYIDDRSYLVEAAKPLGISGFVHESFEKTRDFVLAML